MEIHHKIKPLHGWREFIGEVGIIVFGVLIALGAEQVVEWVHWRHQTEAGNEALAEDFAGIVWQAREREWSGFCISRRLEIIAKVLNEAVNTGRLPAMGGIGGVPQRMWTVNSWDSLVAAGTASHMPRRRLNNIGGIANYARLIDGYNKDELRPWTTLGTIVGPGRRVSDEEVGHLIEALRDASTHAVWMRTYVAQIQQAIRESGVPFEPAYAAALREEGKPDHGRARNDCRIISLPSSLYGYSPGLQAGLERPRIQ